MQNNPINNPSPYGDDDQYNYSGYKKELDKNQKIAVAVLVVFSFLIFSFWFIDAKKGLSDAKNKGVTPSSNLETETCKDGSCDTANVDLKLKDTDSDGLSDYDELNLYNTSPYLEDSDSDGYSDGEEVSSANNPNCPVGRICGSSLETAAPQSPVETPLLNQAIPGSNISEINIPGALNTNLQSSGQDQILGGQGDPASVRQLLLEAGMDSMILDQISDEDLMSTYNDVLGG